jgi:hypothetical protein
LTFWLSLGLYFLRGKEFAMVLFLPILLAGLVLPFDQPPTPAASSVTVQTNAVAEPRRFTLTPGEPRRFSFTGDAAQRLPKQAKPFDRIDPDVVTGNGPPVCLTMRSYYFQRSDDLAPEFVKMTTCESSREIAQKRARRRSARLVPAINPN